MSKLRVPSVRRLIGAARARRALRVRVPPRLGFDETAAGRQRIHYLSPDPTQPRGGVRVFYRHVDLLNEAGFDAVVVHAGRGYRASWFENRTRVVAAADVGLGGSDLLVVPEFYGSNLALLPAGPRIVLFNQGPYYTFVGVEPDAAAALAAPPVEAILTVSQDASRLLGFTFPDAPVHLARSVVDGDVFHPGDGSAPRRRIAYPTNRRPGERHQLLSMLAARGRLAGWEFVPIAGLSETQVADVLRDCAIFLSFSERDGFGLPPAEAMACGCYVIGFHGQGGAEFFDPAFSSPVAEADIVAFARAVEEAALAYDADPTALTRAGLAASRQVLATYHPDGLRADLLAFYGGLGVVPSAPGRGAPGV